MRIVILGAGSFAREVTDLASDLHWDVACYVVDVPDQPKELLGRPVYEFDGIYAIGGTLGFVPGFIGDRAVLCHKMAKRSFYPVALVHPSASVSRTALVRGGAVVSRLVGVGRDAVIGRYTIVNRCASIGHDVQIGESCTIGPNTSIAGNVTLGDGVTVGMGAMIREGVTVEVGAIVGAGALVLQDVPAGECWLGVPARARERNH